MNMDEEYLVRKPKLLRTESTQESAMTSFIEPFNFAETERETLEKLLRQQRISDEEGHQLLIAATEYEIALCRDSAAKYAREQPPAAPQQQPGSSDNGDHPVATAATALATLLRQMPEGLRRQITDHLSRTDPLGRDYGEGFLSCLPSELERIAAACANPTPTPTPEEEIVDSPAEALPGYMQKFVLQMAEIYSECLETEPTAESSGPFYRYMECITDYGDLLFTRGSAELQTLLQER